MLTKNFKNEKIKEIKEEMNEISIDLANEYYGSLAFIGDAIMQMSDDYVDYSNNDLKTWLQNDNKAVDYIEESVLEFGIDYKNFNFYKLLSMGQFLKYERQLYNDLENIIILCALYTLPKDADGETIDRVCNNINDKIDHNNQFCDISYEIAQLIKELAEDNAPKYAIGLVIERIDNLVEIKGYNKFNNTYDIEELKIEDNGDIV